ncbi:MAG: type II secretion system protein GspK [Methylococcales bacterium]|nr:type II secretion system protein GspK [Methylococcales bacterium]
MIRQSGFALVLVLWILSLLTIMAGSFALSMRREAAITEGIKNNAQALAVAESGIAMAEMMLLNPDEAKRWRTDGSIYEIDSGAAKVRVRLLSEMGKIDINHANQALLEALVNNAQALDDKKGNVVSAILDWRDKDDLIRLNGAEKDEYKEAGLSYAPRNKSFQSIEELQLVLGMEKELYYGLEPLITVYSRQPQVTKEQAAKEVLLVLPNVDPALIDEYVAARVASAVNDQPAPPFPANAELTSVDETGQIEDGGQIEEVGQVTVLTLVSEASLDDESSAMISVVVEKTDETEATPFKVLKWQQVTTNDASLFSDAMSELVVKQYAQPEFDN